jgi:D-alanyl-D-alanine carboxypeptidase (penicillin-binding protein 5/6)
MTARQYGIIITALWIASSLLPINVACGSDRNPLVSRAALVLDSDTGALLFAKNADQRMYPASTTKVMTAIMAIESGRLDETVTVKRSDTYVVPSIIGLIPGEEITLRDLVYGLMLRSGNDAARAIARHLAGSQEEFAKAMNERLRELGCRGTHFMNAHGLPHRYHYTTARDLGSIMRHAMSLPEFRVIIASHQYRSESTRKKRVFHNKNKLLDLYEGTLGGKPGYTSAAQQTLVASAQRNGSELVIVCLHSIGKSLWSDAMHLFNLGFEQLEDRQALSSTSLNMTSGQHP